MLQGVNRHAHKCHKAVAPNFLQGAAFCPQQCHNGCAPASFIWCQLRIAAMLLEQRTKGRAAPWPQQCHMRLALPNQFKGTLT